MRGHEDTAGDVREAAVDRGEPAVDRGEATAGRGEAAAAEFAEVAAFRDSLGLDALIDVHTHFMPDRVMAKVWAYFDAAGPLVGRHWPITYRT